MAEHLVRGHFSPSARGFRCQSGNSRDDGLARSRIRKRSLVDHKRRRLYARGARGSKIPRQARRLAMRVENLNQCAITGPGAVGGLPGGGSRLRYRWRSVPDARTKKISPSSNMNRKMPMPNQAELRRGAARPAPVFTFALSGAFGEFSARAWEAARGLDGVAIAASYLWDELHKPGDASRIPLTKFSRVAKHFPR